MKKSISLIIALIFLPFIASAHGGEHDDLIIRMTKNGFEPNEMTVTQNDAVLFINNDTVPHSPTLGSNYPEFKVPINVAPSDSFKFTFLKVGTWPLSDTLGKGKGTIVVLQDPNFENASNAPTSIETPLNNAEHNSFFSNIKSFFSSLFHKIADFFTPNTVISESNTGEVKNGQIAEKDLQEFKALDEKSKTNWIETTAKNDPKLAWQYIKLAYNTPVGVVGNPHDLAHLVGRYMFKKYGLDGLPNCDPSFAFGCYHGLMAEALYNNKPEEYPKNLLAAESGCQKIGSDISPSFWSCIHGIGHGIATYRNYKITSSLKDCDGLNEKVRTYCYDGVFMEFSLNAPSSFYSKVNPIAPCDSVGDTYNIACARSQVQVMRLRLGMNTDQIANACVKTGIKNVIYHCIDALGYFIGQIESARPDKIISGCKEIQNEAAAAQCMAAAAGELVFQNQANWQNSVKEICGNLKGDLATACNARVENVKKTYDRN